MALDQQHLDTSRLSRRRFLAASGAVVTAGLAAAPATARPPRGGRPGPLAPFAVVADSHLDPYVPGHTANLAAVFDHIAAREAEPEFLFHVGDVVEAGFPDEYAEWERVLPAAYADRVAAVPGNHETRWDEWARELYLREFGPTPYAFDAAGVHVVALDPTQLLQEPGYFARRQLEWLERDLRRTPRGVPSVVFLHYPVGGDNFYVGNQAGLLEVLERSGVKAVIAGHVHREDVVRQNGFHMITLPGVLNVPAYHWVEPSQVSRRRALTITRAQRGAAGWAVTPVAEVALDDPPPTPPAQHVAFDAGAVTVRLRPGADAATVRARLYPEALFGGRTAAGWVELAASGVRRWSGTVATAGLAGGVYRLQVQARFPDGQWDTVRRVTLPGDGPLRAAWALDLGAEIQAGLRALPGGRVVAATTLGRVSAVDGDGREAWRQAVPGTVIGTPLADPAGERVFVASGGPRPQDDRITALDAASGRELWRFDSVRPALASPAWADGTILAPAGRILHALDPATGRPRWSADVGGFVAGRAGSDATTAYVGAGDGKAHAFDLATGERRWTRVIEDRGTPYRTLIYGPWHAYATVLPGGRVFVATVVAGWALDAATGEQAWRLPGGFMYNAPLLVDGRLVLVTEFGVVQSVDPLTGAEQWRATLPQRVLGGSPVLWDGAIAVAGVNGLVALLDPATGADSGRLHPGTDYVHSAPAAVTPALLAVGGQDGVLRAIGR